MGSSYASSATMSRSWASYERLRCARMPRSGARLLRAYATASSICPALQPCTPTAECRRALCGCTRSAPAPAVDRLLCACASACCTCPAMQRQTSSQAPSRSMGSAWSVHAQHLLVHRAQTCGSDSQRLLERDWQQGLRLQAWTCASSAGTHASKPMCTHRMPVTPAPTCSPASAVVNAMLNPES